MQYGKQSWKSLLLLILSCCQEVTCKVIFLIEVVICLFPVTSIRITKYYQFWDNLRREDMLEVPRRNWCKPSSLSLELAILFLISSMEICVQRLSWCSNFLAFYKTKFFAGVTFSYILNWPFRKKNNASMLNSLNNLRGRNITNALHFCSVLYF